MTVAEPSKCYLLKYILRTCYVVRSRFKLKGSISAMAGRRCFYFIPVGNIGQSCNSSGPVVRGIERRQLRLLSCYRNDRATKSQQKNDSDSFFVLPKIVEYKQINRRFYSNDGSNVGPSVGSQTSGPLGDAKSDGGAVKSSAGTVKSANPLSDEPTGEKTYDRNFITALRAMQDFLLKPGKH